MEKKNAVLKGIRVIEFALWQQGPLCTSMLGDLGAEIIKIENPAVGGDPARGQKRISGVVESRMGDGLNFYFEYLNRSKKSVTLDLSKEKGKEALYKLVKKSDVFATNFRYGVAERIGAGYKELSKHNPMLVYCNMTGVGSRGPDKYRPSFDIAAQARGGLFDLAGDPGVPPQILSATMADQIGAVTSCMAILAGLMARERNGVGQEIETSLLNSLIWMQGIMAPSVFLGKGEYGRFPSKRAQNPLWNYYLCADGNTLVLALSESTRYWPDLCRFMGMDELRDDPRFADDEARASNCEELIKIMSTIISKKSYPEWEKILSQNKDFVFEKVKTYPEVLQDPQVKANDYIIECEHPVWGKIKMLNFPAQFSKTPVVIDTPTPVLGQHTEEVLIELGGYTWDELAEMRDEGVIL